MIFQSKSESRVLTRETNECLNYRFITAKRKTCRNRDDQTLMNFIKFLRLSFRRVHEKKKKKTAFQRSINSLNYIFGEILRELMIIMTQHDEQTSIKLRDQLQPDP